MNKQKSSRSCFMCGKENPVGLKMEWLNEQDDMRIHGQVVVPDHFNGFPGVVHGGIVSAILDETAARVPLLIDADNLMMTVKLEVIFKAPTPTETTLTVYGWVEKLGARKGIVCSSICTPNGTVTATCKAMVMKPSEQVAAGWEKEKPFWKIY